MKYQVEIDIMPHKELLDPQGKAVMQGLGNLGLKEFSNVRVGKHVSLQIEAADESQANELADQACKKLLANVIMEGYSFEISPLD